MAIITDLNLYGTDSDDVLDLSSGAIPTTTYHVVAYEGNDAIYLGDDVYNASVSGGDGVDTIFLTGSRGSLVDLYFHTISFELADGIVLDVENVFGGSGDDTIVGNDGNNLLNGGDGGDVLWGGDGIDTLDYRNSDAGVLVDLGSTGSTSGGYADADVISGFERLWGSAFDDVLTGDAGRNQLVGYSGDDLLSGGAGVDVLRGLDGADTLDGGMGGDRLTGGADDDVFAYTRISDSRVWAQRDTITDFQAGDKIDLSAIDADASADGDQAFHFGAMFDGTAGALRCGMTGSGMTVLADLDGDRHIDFAINLEGVSSLSASDFIL